MTTTALHYTRRTYQGALHHLDIEDHRNDVLDALVEGGAGLLLLRLIRSRLGGGGSRGGIIIAIVNLNKGVLVVLGLELVAVGPLIARLVRKLRHSALDGSQVSRAYLLHELTLGAVDGGERALQVLTRLADAAPALEADVSAAAIVRSEDLDDVELVVVLADVRLEVRVSGRCPNRGT